MPHLISKLLHKIAGDKPGVELSSELKTSLSFIESGFFPVSMNDKTVFMFKGDRSEVDSVKEAERIFIGFECIIRPEFPSVRMSFEVKDRTHKVRLFDYFFGVESDEDMALLKSLQGQDYFDILVFDSDHVTDRRRVKLGEDEKTKIESMLNGICKGNPD